MYLGVDTLTSDQLPDILSQARMQENPGLNYINDKDNVGPSSLSTQYKNPNKLFDEKESEMNSDSKSFQSIESCNTEPKDVNNGRLSKIQQSNPSQTINDRELYVNRTLLSDLMQTWLTPFIKFAMTQEKVTEDNMQHLQREDRSVNLYNDWCINEDENIHQGVFKYGLQLVAVEISTILSIYLIRMIIDYLQNTEQYPSWYCLLRIAAILNIFTKDIDAFVTGSWQFPYLLVVPLNTIISALILFNMFGLVVVFCYIGMILLLFLQYYSNRKLSKLQFELYQKSDSRIQYFSQVLLGIKAIKLNLWEKVFADKINDIRGQELEVFTKYINIKNICGAIYQNAGTLISSIIFLFADKETLELGKVFSTLALLGYIFNFSILYSNYAIEAIYNLKVFDKRITTVIESAFQIKKLNNTLVEATIINRICFFSRIFIQQKLTLIDDDYDNMSAFHTNRKLRKQTEEDQQRKNAKPYIKLENIYSQWNLQEDKDTGEDIDNEANIEHTSTGQYDTVIKDVSFEFSNNEKIAVIGKVGSGKTSLFLTMLKELCISKGKITLNSSDIAYAEQNPLIISGTVRSNILFGMPYNKKWYQTIVDSCCLNEDFKNLSKGDMTKLGEMGTQLSGGQRYRISLARALYKKDSKVVLLDGSLSALDSRVARDIMENAIKCLCKDKIVFLVTYDLDQAAELDYVILMENGSIARLKKSQEFFQSMEEDNNLIQRLRQDLMQATQATTKPEEPEVDSSNKKSTQIIKEENKQTGKVKWQTYTQFFSYTSCGKYSLLLLILTTVMINLNNLAVSGYLAYTLSNKLNGNDLNQSNYNILLFSIMVFAVLFSFVGKLICNKIFMQINKRLHDGMVNSVLRTKIKFFEENTNGRILNRFSKDVQVLDSIVYTYLDLTDYVVKCSITLIIIVISAPYVLIMTAISGYVLCLQNVCFKGHQYSNFLILWKIRAINLHLTRDTYRLKSGLMSPINSLIQDTINGLTTIKAFGRGEYFMHKIFDLQDKQTEAFVTSNAVNRWCAFRIDMQAYAIASVFAFFAIFITKIESSQDIAMTAIGFQLAVEIARHFNTAVRWSATLENDMVAIQRLFEYINLSPEHKSQINQKEIRQASIEFQDVEMRYSRKLDPALTELSFTINHGEKVAVVGRTGSGKSSLFQLIHGFRQPMRGNIMIDGNSTQTLDVKDLRLKTSAVLQSNFIMSSATIKENLDPLNQFSENEISQALTKSGLDSLSHNSICNSLSAGQIQLLSLSAAFLKKNSLLVLLDEPTSQIDNQTQKKVLKNLFKYHQKSTVLMIAHRLETAVTYCDKILVLDIIANFIQIASLRLPMLSKTFYYNGQLAEFDHPFKLLVNQIDDSEITKTQSIFAQMVLALNTNQQNKIFQKAKQKYLQ